MKTPENLDNDEANSSSSSSMSMTTSSSVDLNNLDSSLSTILPESLQEEKNEVDDIDLPSLIFIRKAHVLYHFPQGSPPCVRVLLLGDHRRSQLFLPNIIGSSSKPLSILYPKNPAVFESKNISTNDADFFILDTIESNSIAPKYHPGLRQNYRIVMVFSPKIALWFDDITENFFYDSKEWQAFIPQYKEATQTELVPIALGGKEMKYEGYAPTASPDSACEYAYDLLKQCTRLIFTNTEVKNMLPPLRVAERKIRLPSLVIITRQSRTTSTVEGFLGRRTKVLTKVITLSIKVKEAIEFARNLSPKEEKHGAAMHTADLIQCEIKGELFHVWNTAGQERFHSISRNYFQGASIILIFGEDGRDWFKEIDQLVNEDMIPLTPEYSISNHTVTLAEQISSDQVRLGSTIETSPAEGRRLGQQLLQQCTAYIASNNLSTLAGPALRLGEPSSPSTYNCCTR